jgi:hypothetical protein
VSGDVNPALQAFKTFIEAYLILASVRLSFMLGGFGLCLWHGRQDTQHHHCGYAIHADPEVVADMGEGPTTPLLCTIKQSQH